MLRAGVYENIEPRLSQEGMPYSDQETKRQTDLLLCFERRCSMSLQGWKDFLLTSSLLLSMVIG